MNVYAQLKNGKGSPTCGAQHVREIFITYSTRLLMNERSFSLFPGERGRSQRYRIPKPLFVVHTAALLCLLFLYLGSMSEELRAYLGEDTWVDKLALGALGLAGEAGEVVDAIKRRSDSAAPARSGGAASGARGCALVPGADRQHL